MAIRIIKIIIAIRVECRNPNTQDRNYTEIRTQASLDFSTKLDHFWKKYKVKNVLASSDFGILKCLESELESAVWNPD